MNQEEFVAQHAERWQAFENMLKVGTPASDLSELPRRYREICHHLALARDRHYSSALMERLESLALAGHQALYGAHEGQGGIRAFLFGGFPALVRKQWRYVLVSAALLYLPLAACLVSIQYFPDFAHVIVRSEQLAEIQQMYSPAAKRLGAQRGAQTDVAMFGFYIYNNVRIDFQCFAGGLLFGVGAIFFLLFNGIFIGTVAGHLTHVGYVETFWSFVAGHSAFELTGAVLSGAAGLMLGMALIAPGRLGRFASVKSRLPDIMGLVYGAALLTFLAAFIEAFWSSSRVPPATVKYIMGGVMWSLTLAYFAWLGRGARHAA
jgi:uncharacterized membrane protein SpoIIM required for sporulation